MTIYASAEEWRAEARRLFGDDPMQWRFVCPSCGHVASVADWKAAGASEREVAFSCVGRHLEHRREIFEKPGPCNYAGGGLLRLNPVSVLTGKGESVNVFEFATPSPKDHSS